MVDVFSPRVVIRALWLSGTSKGPIARATPRVSPRHHMTQGKEYQKDDVNTDSTSLISEQFSSCPRKQRKCHLPDCLLR